MSRLIQDIDAHTLYIDLNAILSTIYDEILVVSADGELLRHSQTMISDFWEAVGPDLIGKNMLDLEQQGYFTPSVTRLVIEQRKKVSVIQTSKQGKKVLAVGTPVFDEQGQLQRVIIASRDITETYILKQALLLTQQEVESLRERVTFLSDLSFRSPAMYKIYQSVLKIARFPTTVLISGESGVGKEVVATLIHRMGPRSVGPFVKVNCGAIPEGLLESELFGYEKGAFTGADPRGKKGYFEQAHGGILFLDEIGELPLNLQVKLLRVLQEKEVTPVGGQKSIPVDVQIIAATNADLKEKVKQGKFREDLYYRIHVVPLYVPPLRERKEDIASLAYLFLSRFNHHYGRQVSLTPEGISILESYDWPGNVRQLQNIIERLVVLSDADDEIIDAETLYLLLYGEPLSEEMKRIILSVKTENEKLISENIASMYAENTIIENQYIYNPSHAYVNDQTFVTRLQKPMNRHAVEFTASDLDGVVMIPSHQTLPDGFKKFLNLWKAEQQGLPLEVDHFPSLKEVVEAVEEMMIDLALNRFGSTLKAAEVLKVSQPTVSRKSRRLKKG